MATDVRTRHLVEELTSGVAQLDSTPQWRRYLEFQATFHNYSFGNVLLISTQRPDARRVAGFHGWRRIGRTVRRGERAIWILAPMISQPREERSGEEQSIVRGFRRVAVFDVSQTTGDDLPSPVRILEGGDPLGRFEALVRVAHSIGFGVELTNDLAHANGDCNFPERRIRVLGTNGRAQRVKTLAHELAHAICHEHIVDRPLAELEAESVAFVVCRVLEIDTDEYSFGYVASWAGGTANAVKAIRASGERIQSAAAVILARVGDQDEPQPIEARVSQSHRTPEK